MSRGIQAHVKLILVLLINTQAAASDLIYVGNWGNNTVVRLDGKAKPLIFADSNAGLNQPQGLAFDSKWNLYGSPGAIELTFCDKAPNLLSPYAGKLLLHEVSRSPPVQSVHFNRAPRCHRNHCDPSCHAFARVSQGERARKKSKMHFQPPPNWNLLAQLCHG